MYYFDPEILRLISGKEIILGAGGHVFIGISLSVSNITQNLKVGFGGNFQERREMAQEAIN